MFDPYSRDTPGIGEPANNLIAITPDDVNDLPIGIKALRIWNPLDTAATINAITMAGDEVSFPIPPLSLWTEPLRVSRVLTTSTSGIILHGYTDQALPE